MTREGEGCGLQKPRNDGKENCEDAGGEVEWKDYDAMSDSRGTGLEAQIGAQHLKYLSIASMGPHLAMFQACSNAPPISFPQFDAHMATQSESYPPRLNLPNFEPLISTRFDSYRHFETISDVEETATMGGEVRWQEEHAY